MIQQYHKDNQNASMRSATSLNQLSLRRGAKEQAQGRTRERRGVGGSEGEEGRRRLRERSEGRGERQKAENRDGAGERR